MLFSISPTRYTKRLRHEICLSVPLIRYLVFTSKLLTERGVDDVWEWSRPTSAQSFWLVIVTRDMMMRPYSCYRCHRSKVLLYLVVRSGRCASRRRYRSPWHRRDRQRARSTGPSRLCRWSNGNDVLVAGSFARIRFLVTCFKHSDAIDKCNKELSSQSWEECRMVAVGVVFSGCYR